LDIEGIIQKAAEAASTLLRYEFTKLGLIKNISAKVAELEKELNDQNELDDRHDAIESPNCLQSPLV